MARSNPFAKLLGNLFPASRAPRKVDETDTVTATKSDTSKDVPDETTGGGMRTVIGGEANAVGESTRASGEIYSRTFDKGPIKISFGSAEFSASARSPEEDPTYAAADSYASASGADLFLTRTVLSSSKGPNAGQVETSETSRTTYFAIDFEKFDLPRPVTLSQHVEKGGSRAGGADGNVATLDVDARAQAEHTYVGVEAYALSTGTLSTVNAIVVTEAA